MTILNTFLSIAFWLIVVDGLSEFHFWYRKYRVVRRLEQRGLLYLALARMEFGDENEGRE